MWKKACLLVCLFTLSRYYLCMVFTETVQQYSGYIRTTPEL